MKTRIVAIGAGAALLILGRDAAGQGQCALAGTAPVPSSSEACITCHGAPASHSHPLNVDYADAQRRGVKLRPLADVVARGVNVPDGRVQCVSCHDARSPWAHWIVVPTGAVARPANASRDEDAPSWRVPPAGPVPELPRGTEVSTAPLCAACHPFD